MTELPPDVAGQAVPGPTEWGEGPGVGPWQGPLPTGARDDQALLRDGDTRNVVDAYRYWTREAIVADIDTRRHRLHVAIENFGNDANIGSVVRTAGARAMFGMASSQFILRSLFFSETSRPDDWFTAARQGASRRSPAAATVPAAR